MQLKGFICLFFLFSEGWGVMFCLVAQGDLAVFTGTQMSGLCCRFHNPFSDSIPANNRNINKSSWKRRVDKSCWKCCARSNNKRLCAKSDRYFNNFTNSSRSGPNNQLIRRNCNFQHQIRKKTHQNLLCGTCVSYRAHGFLLVCNVFILIKFKTTSVFYNICTIFI